MPEWWQSHHDSSERNQSRYGLRKTYPQKPPHARGGGVTHGPPPWDEPGCPPAVRRGAIRLGGPCCPGYLPHSCRRTARAPRRGHALRPHASWPPCARLPRPSSAHPAGPGQLTPSGVVARLMRLALWGEPPPRPRGGTGGAPGARLRPGGTACRSPPHPVLATGARRSHRSKQMVEILREFAVAMEPRGLITQK
jgi:hypothetical protein